MSIKIKYIGLILGLLSTVFSFLFFGRAQGTYQLLLTSGLLTSTIFFLAILFSKETAKSKILWTLVVLSAIAILALSEQFLINTSYLIFINSNSNELNEVNSILSNKTGEIHIMNDDITDKDSLLTVVEKDNLIELRRKLDVYMITKTENEIYYGLWGFLDVRLGLIYWTKDENPDIKYQQLKDRWYH